MRWLQEHPHPPLAAAQACGLGVRDDIRAKLDWITALRAPQIRALPNAGAFQLSLLDKRDLPMSPRPTTPTSASSSARSRCSPMSAPAKREALLIATEAALALLSAKIDQCRGPECKNRSKPAPDFGRKRQVISAESGT
jgi:hypothetical protein